MSSESQPRACETPSGAAGDARLDRKVRALKNPAMFGSTASRVETIETHFAWIFLTETLAFKLKKPLHVDRMDHRTLEARHRSCLEELRLNRRLAPEIYLDVVALRMDEQGDFQIGAQGEIVDWLVKMHRLPADAMLDRAIAARRVQSEAVGAVGRMLADFYLRQPSIAIDPSDYERRIASQIDDDRTRLLAPDLELPRDVVDSAIVSQHRFVTAHPRMLRDRARRGKFLEAHGDLRPEHIYLGTPPCVIDCLEFDRDLRLCDPLEELAFFHLECARAGAAWIGRRIVDIYCEANRDPFEQRLFRFYLSRRASHRAILAAWHLRDPAVRQAVDWRARAINYLKCAHRYLRS